MLAFRNLVLLLAFGISVSASNDLPCSYPDSAAHPRTLAGDNLSGHEDTGGHNASHDTGHDTSHDTGHQQWWQYDYQWHHFEECVVIALVLLTLAFDAAHHHLEHLSSNTPDYVAKAQIHRHGSDYEIAMHKTTHSRTLWELLLQRATGELTVLGFLAFVVWCCSRANVFELMSERLRVQEPLVLPTDATTYLHCTENVHMQLFITMLFYFTVLAFSVFFATKKEIAVWMEASNAVNKGFRDGSIVPGRIEEWCSSQDLKTAQLCRLRESFLSGLQSWRGKWPFFEETLGQIVDHYSPVTENSVKDMLQPFFPLGQYISMNYRWILKDMVKIQPQTWGSILVIMGMQASVHRLGHDVDFASIWMCLSIAVMLVSIGLLTYRLRLLQSGRFKNATVMASPIFHRLSPAVKTCRILQICLFLVCFEIATTVASPDQWESSYNTCVAYMIILVLGLPGGGLLTGYLLARLSIVTACGTFITERNLLRIAVIVERHCEGHDDDRREVGDASESFDNAARELKKRLHHGDFRAGFSATRLDKKAEALTEILSHGKFWTKYGAGPAEGG